jgi:hypothetical protein
MGGGRIKEESKESEYGCCAFYIRMNIEFLKLLNSP